MAERVASAPTTSCTVGHSEHGVGDQHLQVSLQKPGESGQLHGLGNELHPGGGAVGEEGILGVRGGHAEYLIKTCNEIKFCTKIPL